MSGEAHPPAGRPDLEAVHASIQEAAQRAQELQRHAKAARAALSEAAAKLAELERQAADAQKAIASYQEQESEVAREIGDAQRIYDEILRAAQARADEIIQGANVRAGDEVIKSARTRAEELVAQAKSSADEILKATNVRAAEMAAQAKSSADEIVRSARSTATDLLQKAREAAQEQLQEAARVASERRGPAQGQPTEAGEAGGEAEETRKVAEEYLTGVLAKFDAFIRDRDGVSRSLEAAAKHYTDSLETIGRFRTEVQREILPAVDQLLRRLKGGPAAPADAAPPGGTEDDTGRLMPLVSSHEPVVPTRPAAPDRPQREPRERPAATPVASAGHHSGEVALSPVHSFLQATKFITALTQVQGVASVKLKSYSGSTLTLDVVTAGYAVPALDCRLIDGFAVEVVEAEGNHLVLRLPEGPPTWGVSR